MTTTKGLEGIVATTSAISSINRDVLTYRGYSIHDLANESTFEEVVYLLWNGELPSADQLNAFKEKLADNASVPDAIFDIIKSFPGTVHPMAVLRTAISALGVFDPDAERMDVRSNIEKAVRIQAKIGTIVAGFARIRNGEEPISPRKDLGLAANFLYMLKNKVPTDTEAKTFDTALVLHADHELNASTFTARVCVATLSDIYSGVTSAISALKGPLHGGANEQVMNMLEKIGSLDEADDFINDALANKKKIMGFGHRVYKNGDPRARIIKKMVEELTSRGAETKYYDISLRIESIMKEKKGLLPNTDFYSATLYHTLGIRNDLFTPVFAVSRTSGWVAHILEQYSDNRLIRPRAEYNGPDLRPYIPLEER
ncbi:MULTISPECIES: citrate synthase [unclassified Sporolactobacillus]|uniref:citrate synthase n=1 Tax=unclassified Sporolactobacillus TaxID=2628533 RepID=UPI002367E228|nr:citrate synthase [Sporolactobacillus sp. CQH2019]MDD9150830.1 citrate synthase [Sporolactobacillus sp. CQH2019]